MRRQREQMVSNHIFSILGRTSYYSQMYGLFPVLWSYRHPPLVTSRYRRSKLSFTRTRFAPIQYRAYCATRNYFTEGKDPTCTSSRHSLSSSRASCDSLREGTCPYNQGFRLQTRQFGLSSQHCHREGTQSENASAISWTPHRHLAQQRRRIHNRRA